MALLSTDFLLLLLFVGGLKMLPYLASEVTLFFVSGSQLFESQKTIWKTYIMQTQSKVIAPKSRHPFYSRKHVKEIYRFKMLNTEVGLLKSLRLQLVKVSLRIFKHIVGKYVKPGTGLWRRFKRSTFINFGDCVVVTIWLEF